MRQKKVTGRMVIVSLTEFARRTGISRKEAAMLAKNGVLQTVHDERGRGVNLTAFQQAFGIPERHGNNGLRHSN